MDPGPGLGLDVDARDHVWIVQRPWSLASDEKAPNADAPCCHPAPPVMEFDAAGNYVQGWGGEGSGFEWPADEHTIHVDFRNNVWISSAGGPRLPTRKENQILKFAGRWKMWRVRPPRPLRGRIRLPAQRRVDWQGNVHTAEVGSGRRVHKFVRSVR